MALSRASGAVIGTLMLSGAMLFGPAVFDTAAAADTLKIAYIDPLTGAFANVGDQGLKHFQFMADKINAAGGVDGRQIEIVGLDNETNPEKSLILFKKVVDDGIRYITQGNGSSVAFALTDAVAKHNRRNPEQSVLFLNYAAVDPGLTNEKCNFWHFRFDADVDMKMQAITNYLADLKSLKKYYLLNQDYSFGQSVEKAATAMMKQKRPDAELIGADRVPLGKVKDFSPYVAKMQSGGADTVITGNWGNDLSLLVKAAVDNGWKGIFYTYYGGGLGTPTALGQAGKGALQVSEWHANVDAPKIEADAKAFQAKYNQDFYYYRIKVLMEFVAKAMNDAKSVDPLKVAQTMEGMKVSTELGDIEMRADNHQMIQPLYLSVFSDGVKNDVEHTGLGFKTVQRIEAKDTVLPTTCSMQRPS